MLSHPTCVILALVASRARLDPATVSPLRFISDRISLAVDSSFSKTVPAFASEFFRSVLAFSRSASGPFSRELSCRNSFSLLPNPATSFALRPGLL